MDSLHPSLNILTFAEKLWAWRFIGGIRRLTREEQAVYRGMVIQNRSVWDDFIALKQRNPDSYVLKAPFTAQHRPLVGTQVTDGEREELNKQDRLWSYCAALGEILKKYKWPTDMIQSFILLHSHNAQDLFLGFERHDGLLAWMITRKTLSGAFRKLAVLEDRKTRPQLWQTQ